MPLFAWDFKGEALAYQSRLTLDDLVTNGVADQVTHRVQIQLYHDVGPVRLHCLNADVQGVGDFFVGFPLGHQLQDLPLSLAELASEPSVAPCRARAGKIAAEHYLRNSGGEEQLVFGARPPTPRSGRSLRQP